MWQKKISQFIILVKLIITNGSVWIKPFDYQSNTHRLWNNNSLSKKINITRDFRKRSFKHHILFLPIIGPTVALISHYRLQKKWPTYVYHWPEKKLAYVRISKNACTSVQAAFLQKQYSDVNISELSVNQINEMGKMYIKPYLEPGYDCFTLVRNPYDRLLSCYFDQVLGRDNHFYFDDYLFRVLKKGMTFENFVTVIKDIPNAIKDIHFRPQHEYIKQLEKVKCFKIGKDEEQLNIFLKKYDLELGDFNINESTFNKSDYYTPAIKKMVAEIYHKDFQHFEYSKE